MRKLLIFVGVAIVLVAILWPAANMIRLKQTKALSPEETVTYTDGKLKISVFYNRPSKKGRVIFGELVPYGKVWRTGANEATIFETNQILTIGGQRLPAGKYTLWTIPDVSSWQVLFNMQTGQWGINSKGEANRDPNLDALTVTAQSIIQDRDFEQFTIQFNSMSGEAEMVLLWDKTVVVVPFTYNSN